MLRTPVGRLRALGMLEAVSFLILLGVAMPLKYLAGLPAGGKNRRFAARIAVPGLLYGLAGDAASAEVANALDIRGSHSGLVALRSVRY